MKRDSAGKSKIVTKDKQKDKQILKRTIFAVVAVLAVLVVVLIVLQFVLDNVQKKPETKEEYSFRNYYMEDYNADIFSEEEYICLDRRIMFSTLDGWEYDLLNVDESALGYGEKFFIEYFELVTHGRYEEYPDLFTKEYRENPEGFEKYVNRHFTQQRIHDINIRMIADTANTKEEYTYNGQLCTYGYYEVSFKVFHNDGTFRRDLPENGVVPVIFELVTPLEGENAGRTMIKNLYTVESLKASQGE